MFSLELSKSGKPHILYDNFKYRESYSLKNGEVVWRCLGKTCSATIKTDESKKELITVNAKHTGHHPVTMRSLSTPQRNISPPSASLAAELGTSTPRVSSPAAEPGTSTPRVSSPAAEPGTSTPRVSSPAAEPGTSTPRVSSPAAEPGKSTSRAPSPAPAAPCDVDPSSPAAIPLVVSEWEIENSKLKKELELLKEDRKKILNHSIESDTRLLQFTDQVFVAGSRQRHLTRDQAVQCESVGCLDSRCAENRNLLASLRTTIEVLEAEVAALRAEKKTCECFKEGDGEWTIQKNRKLYIKLQNRYHLLPEEKNTIPSRSKTINKKIEKQEVNKNIKSNSKNINKAKKKQHARRKNNNRVKTSQLQSDNMGSRKTLDFSSVVIEGDSHARGLAALLQQRVDRRTSVTGICKLGAVTSASPPPSRSCCVILAGTNDIAAGESQTIFRDLEQRILTRTGPASVLLATVPHRHDLPARHPVNQQTRLVNNYMEELCVRHKRLHLLNFNSISRRWFTGHGMHLGPEGKCLLTELILDHLASLSARARIGLQPRVPPTQPAPSSNTLPATPAETPPPPPPLVSSPPPRVTCFQLDSYADCLKDNIDHQHHMLNLFF
ncbi:hypothetical protein J6590_075843 [Homalodisca vitripennis]|nr:hypothetical protein J6590_075843 [Homalodisca vitripennis]